jgi:hypothetical protein
MSETGRADIYYDKYMRKWIVPQFLHCNPISIIYSAKLPHLYTPLLWYDVDVYVKIFYIFIKF